MGKFTIAWMRVADACDHGEDSYRHRDTGLKQGDLKAAVQAALL